MELWIENLLKLYTTDDMSWEAKRRIVINQRWNNASVRAAEQDARNGKPEALQQYVIEVLLIKEAIPKV